jgi:hypothetical protein
MKLQAMLFGVSNAVGTKNGCCAILTNKEYQGCKEYQEQQ